jgi:uncharacterized surface protein with fasciclin (FAS1) repeats
MGRAIEFLKDITMITTRLPKSTTLKCVLAFSACAFALAACGQPSNDPATTNTVSDPVAPASTTPDTSASTTMPGAAGTTPTTAGDIIDVATANPDFSTLVAAIQAADLGPTLKGAGPFTLFAPTNAAFDKLPAGTVENLLKPENRAQLVSILNYHVVPGRVRSGALAGATSTLTSVQGGTISVDGSNGVKVNNATVVTPDITASNGVIHVIDTVIMPPA